MDEYAVNKKVLSDDIKMMHEFIEFKYFKEVMKRNNNISDINSVTLFIQLFLYFAS